MFNVLLTIVVEKVLKMSCFSETYLHLKVELTAVVGFPKSRAPCLEKQAGLQIGEPR